jgi:hypothetical protein
VEVEWDGVDADGAVVDGVTGLVDEADIAAFSLDSAVLTSADGADFPDSLRVRDDIGEELFPLSVDVLGLATRLVSESVGAFSFITGSATVGGELDGVLGTAFDRGDSGVAGMRVTAGAEEGGEAAADLSPVTGVGATGAAFDGEPFREEEGGEAVVAMSHRLSRY